MTTKREEALSKAALQAITAGSTYEPSAKDIAKAAKALEDQEKAVREAGELVSGAPIPGLPALLNARRIQYEIPDAVFEMAAVFDRIFVQQIADRETDYYDAAQQIIKPENWADKEVAESPRGVVVSAGLAALDVLASNGMGLGHVVRFAEVVPFRMHITTVAGVEFNILMMRVGDITASEDLMTNMRSRNIRVVQHTYNQDGAEVREHLLVDENGKTWNPQTPQSEE